MTVALVTGANGFLGRHVRHELTKRGIPAVGLYRSSASADRHSILLSEPPTQDNLRAILDGVAPSTIFHLAGATRSNTPEELYQANVFFAAHLLEAALNTRRPPTVVLVGSAAEYGHPMHADFAVRETDPCAPLSPYGISKLAQTLHGLSHFSRGLPVVVARLFNPIGVGAPMTTALGSFVAQLAATPSSGRTLTTGPLDAVRDFVDVLDAARALVDLAENRTAFGQIVNVCTGVGTSVQNLVDRLIALVGAPIVHEIDTRRGGASDIQAVVGDTERHQQLGIAIPPPDIDAILRNMLAAARAGNTHLERFAS
ncbi:NAD-dependent epimerase/dehydratase family protein [Bradyrhizobium sp. BR 1432]|uniref:NAD-dependent epimerase/dehydratase family protein n=1 Tax=Bradyrhizobium sp. BR 1432 TaxID=3447966 RepID=UPI003EE64F7D